MVDIIMETPLQHEILGKTVDCKRSVPKNAMAASRSDNVPPPVILQPLGTRPSYGPAPREDTHGAYSQAYAEGYAKIQALLNGSGPPSAAPAGKGRPAYRPAGKGKGAPYGRPY